MLAVCGIPSGERAGSNNPRYSGEAPLGTFARSLTLPAENTAAYLAMRRVRQIIGMTGLIFAVITAASRWKIVPIGPTLGDDVCTRRPVVRPQPMRALVRASHR